MKYKTEIGVVLLILGAIVVIGIWAKGVQEEVEAEHEGQWRAKFQAEAIENGAAYFDPNTGTFTWIQRKPVEIRQVVITEDSE